MSKAYLTRGFSLAAIAAAAVLASCSTGNKEPEAPPPPPPPPPVSLNEGVAEAASIYVAFLREMETIQAGGFTDAEAIQAAIRKGAAYDPAQLSRGMIAYGAVLALQSPEFVAGVRQFAVDPEQRQRMVAQIIADPAYAATLPGAPSAAGLIIETLGKDASAVRAIADGIEQDAYTIQERNDPRRRWATVHIANREERLEGAKTISANPMLPTAEEASRLFQAANTGSGLNISAATRSPPYTPPVTRSLAIAALAALGAAGDEARVNTDALVMETNNEFCLNMSKLMLYQCLAAARPSYEDMFCLGRHIVRDLATCTTEATLAPHISVGDPVETAASAATAAQTMAPAAPQVTLVPAAAQTPAVTPAPNS